MGRHRQRQICSPNIWFFVNILCVLAVVIQLAFNFRDFLFPRLTNTRVEARTIQEDQFPLIFKICVQPAINKEALEEAGYKGTHGYFSGQSAFNKSIFGWAGHTNDSGTYGTVEEVYRKVSSYAPEDIIQNIKINPGNVLLNHSHVDLGIEFPQNCLRLDIAKVPEVKNKTIKYITFQFDDEKNITSVQIVPYGRHLISHRDFFHFSFYSTGDAIISEPGRIKRFGVEISENVYVEEDQDKHCREYPNKEHTSFGDCDSQYVKSVCEKHNIHPIFLNSNDFKNVTVQYVLSEEDASLMKSDPSKQYILSDLISLVHDFSVPGNNWQAVFGVLNKSPCLTPCTTFHTKTKLLTNIKEKTEGRFRLRLFSNFRFPFGFQFQG